MNEYEKERSVILNLNEEDLLEISKMQAKNLKYKNVLFDKMQVKRMFDDSQQIPEEIKKVFWNTFRETIEIFKTSRTKYIQNKIECLKRKIAKESNLLNKLNSIEL